MFFFYIICFPLLSFFVLLFYGYLIGYSGSLCLVGIYATFFFFLSILGFYYTVFFNSFYIIDLGSWIKSSYYEVSWVFIFDSLSMSMILLVSSVTFVVILFSFNYIYMDQNRILFLSYIMLFSFFMILLVTSGDLVLLFFGWEGVGICSFLLISFWRNRLKAVKSGLKAIFFNRVGDSFFLLALSLIFLLAGSTNYFVIFNYLPYFYSSFMLNIFGLNFSILDILFLFFFVGVVGKSAQIGFHVWLLDAMEGPTPVSALIHAATMVTAGVFLLIRLSFLLEYVFLFKFFIVLIGALTAFFSSLTGSVQNDLKSIVAYSTCSQLGYMVLITGFSMYSSALFHLISHGFFKALLFLSSGVLIHNFFEEQDIRKMGGLFFIFPLTYFFIFSGSLSLLGFPFLSGFYSKDLIIEFLFSFPFFWSNLIFFLAVISVFFTCFYSIRLLYYVFLSSPNGYKFNYTYSIEQYSVFMLLGMSFLFFSSVFFGFSYYPLFFINFGSTFFFNSIYAISPLIRTVLYLEFFFFQSSSFWFSFKMLSFYFIIFSFIFFLSSIIFYNYFKLLYSYSFFFYFYSLVYNGFFFNYIYLYFFSKFIFFFFDFFIYLINFFLIIVLLIFFRIIFFLFHFILINLI